MVLLNLSLLIATCSCEGVLVLLDVYFVLPLMQVLQLDLEGLGVLQHLESRNFEVGIARKVQECSMLPPLPLVRNRTSR